MMPKLAAATADKPLVMIGGLPVQAKVRKMQSEWGVTCEWVDAYHDAMNGVRSVAEKTKNGSFTAVLLCQHLLGHKTSRLLIDACRSFGVPVAYAGKAGIGEIRSALIELEGRMP